MNKKDEEIQRKLEELETTILKETPSEKANLPAVSDKSRQPSISNSTRTNNDTSVQSDLYYFGGVALILFGLFMIFQHIRVGSGILGMLGIGSSGFGLLLLPLMIGLGWIFYDSKSKVAWALTAGSCALIILAVLCSISLVFPMVSLTQMIIMLLPFAIGGALLLKGIGGPKGLEEKLKKSKL